MNTKGIQKISVEGIIGTINQIEGMVTENLEIFPQEEGMTGMTEEIRMATEKGVVITEDGTIGTIVGVRIGATKDGTEDAQVQGQGTKVVKIGVTIEDKRLGTIEGL